MKTHHLLLLAFVLFASFSYSQKTVSGTITSADGLSLIGANVLEVGTSNGTITDLDGNYSVTVSDRASLEVSYTGFTTQIIDASNGTLFNVNLSEGSVLDEVVVTALGITREKKALSYAAQSVSTEELSKARELNVVNSLSGKVAGISVARSGSGVGADSRVILRGNRSLFGSSQPLYVVDGVPILGDVTDINPDDIESISVLKGANAAALYGNRAQNGAIIMTTKQGGQGFKVSLNTSYTTETPLLLRSYQEQFAQGNSGQYNAASEQAWGPAITGQSVDHWSPNPEFGTPTYNLNGDSPVADFFQTGSNFATNLAVSGGTDKSKTYFSYTYTDAKGVVPSNELKRHSVNIRMTNKLSDRITLDAKANYIREDLNNPLSQGESFDNPVRHALRLPPNIRTEDVSQFDYTDASGALRQHYWNPGSNGGANPYWTINRNLREVATNRIIGLVGLKYDITDKVNVQVRSALDTRAVGSEYRQFNDNYIIADNGRFTVNKNDALEWNTDILATYTGYLSDDLSLSLSAGANARKERGTSLTSNSQGGAGLIVPNLFGLGNTGDVQSNFNIGGPRDVNSVYAFANIGFKNSIYLDITARNDWSSTLPSENWAFFYPSVGLSLVLSDLVKLPSAINFAKLRGSWAQVGNDATPFQLQRLASVGAGGANGFLTLDGTLRNEDLLPEETTGIEIGADLRLFNKFGLDFTYYKSNTRNQLFSIALPIGSGASQIFTNGGDVQNSGIEAVLTFTAVDQGNFRWDVGFNYTKNNSNVLEINDERPSVTVGGDFLRSFRIEQGSPWGNVYSRGFQRNDAGQVLIGEDGLPLISDGLTINVANFNPDWLGGISNNIQIGDIDVSFLVDIRKGGSVASLTDAIVFGDGLTEETLLGREGGLVFGDNFFPDEETALAEGVSSAATFDAETFWRRVGGRNAPVGEVFSRDATNVRLRELVVGYNLPIAENNYIKGASVSLVGRNLFFFLNRAETLDPEVINGTGTAAEGFNSFEPPTSRSLGVNLKIDF
jgi:TonB-linked SusC/RagA family outer membrane protein